VALPPVEYKLTVVVGPKSKFVVLKVWYFIYATSVAPVVVLGIVYVALKMPYPEIVSVKG
jgi:hypothetical protein